MIAPTPESLLMSTEQIADLIGNCDVGYGGHVLYPPWNGFSGETCSGCEKTINIPVREAGETHSCPCGEFFLTSNHLQPPHDQPDYGPSKATIQSGSHDGLKRRTAVMRRAQAEGRMRR